MSVDVADGKLFTLYIDVHFGMWSNIRRVVDAIAVGSAWSVHDADANHLRAVFSVDAGASAGAARRGGSTPEGGAVPDSDPSRRREGGGRCRRRGSLPAPHCSHTVLATGAGRLNSPLLLTVVYRGGTQAVQGVH